MVCNALSIIIIICTLTIYEINNETFPFLILVLSNVNSLRWGFVGTETTKNYKNLYYYAGTIIP